MFHPLSESGRMTAADRKRKQRANEKARRVDARERQRKSRQKARDIKTKNRSHRERNIERQRKWRAKHMLQLINLENPDELPNFPNKMNKYRAVRKLKEALPLSPYRRAATVAAYLSNTKSPSVKKLHECKIIPSPEEVRDRKLGDAVLRDIKETVSCARLKRSDDARAAMTLLTASVSGECVASLKSKRSLSQKLGLTPKRITKAVDERAKLLNAERDSFIHTERKTRRDAVTTQNKQVIYDFWCSPENSHPTGNKNDVKRLRLAPKIYSSHATQILEKTQTEVYTDFRCQHPSIRISQRQFEKYKPYFVRPANRKDRVTCCCRYHLEMKFLFNTCMTFRKKISDGSKLYETITDVCNDTLCKPDNDNLYNKTCLDRKCKKCGTEHCHFTEEEMRTDDLAEDTDWQCFEYRELKTKNGSRRKLMLVKKKTKPGHMFRYFKELLATFPGHNFRAKWQNQQIRHLVENLPENHCVAVHDYSENYKCGEKSELQSDYFQKTEVSIHVTILHRHAQLEFDGVQSTSEDPHIISEHFYVLSDDVKHDQNYTHQVQAELSQYLKSIGYRVDVMHEFCDGCASQYKSRHCFGDLSGAPTDFGYKQIVRNFFETSHAKGPQDAAGGLLKYQADMAVLRGKYFIQNAADLYNFAISALTVPKSEGCKRRVFRYIPTITRTTSRSYKPILGIRSIHQVTADGTGTLMLRQLSCYSCDDCLEGNMNRCTRAHILGSATRCDVQKEDDHQSIEAVDVPENDDDCQAASISELVSKSSIIAVLCNDPNSDYYLVRANTSSIHLDTATTDSWGTTYSAGAAVIKGNYFQQSQVNPLQFTLIRNKLALVPSLSVLYICADISLKNAAVHLTLPEDVHMSIMKCVDMCTYTR